MKICMRIRSYSCFIGKGLLGGERCGCTEYIVSANLYTNVTFIIQTVDSASQVLWSVDSRTVLILSTLIWSL